MYNCSTVVVQTVVHSYYLTYGGKILYFTGVLITTTVIVYINVFLNHKI